MLDILIHQKKNAWTVDRKSLNTKKKIFIVILPIERRISSLYDAAFSNTHITSNRLWAENKNLLFTVERDGEDS